MSKISNLTELARFVGKSPFSSRDKNVRQMAIKSLKQNYLPKSTKGKVSDLIDIVMIRSAQARRKGQARVIIDLDVFAPNNSRAVRLSI